MRYSRTGIVAVLLAAEVFLAGAILWSVHGNGFSVRAAGLHRVAMQGKTFPPLEAGTSPRVLVDDPESHVIVTTSDDGKVHVTDDSGAEGWYWGRASRPALAVTRTGDGVSISRAAGQDRGFQFFGFSRRRIEIAVPAGSMLDVRRCSAADVTGLTGEVRIRSVDGHIAATNVRTERLSLATDDGSVSLRDVNATALDASTQDGSIRASGVQTSGGSLHSEDGSISLALAANSNLAIHARTADGRVTFDGRREGRGDDDSSSGDYQVGSGAGSLQISTQDGSIHIISNGAQ